jgi:hypothetical protein
MLQPSLVGAVVVGDATWPTRYVRSVPRANRVKQSYLARSTALGAPFTATVVPVYATGAVEHDNAAAKTYLQGLKLRTLKGPGVTTEIAIRLKT